MLALYLLPSLQVFNLRGQFVSINLRVSADFNTRWEGRGGLYQYKGTTDKAEDSENPLFVRT